MARPPLHVAGWPRPRRRRPEPYGAPSRSASRAAAAAGSDRPRRQARARRAGEAHGAKDSGGRLWWLNGRGGARPRRRPPRPARGAGHDPRGRAVAVRPLGRRQPVGRRRQPQPGPPSGQRRRHVGGDGGAQHGGRTGQGDGHRRPDPPPAGPGQHLVPRRRLGGDGPRHVLEPHQAVAARQGRVQAEVQEGVGGVRRAGLDGAEPDRPGPPAQVGHGDVEPAAVRRSLITCQWRSSG